MPKSPRKNSKVDNLKRDLNLYTERIKKEQKEKDFLEFNNFILKILYTLEDNEGNALRKNYDEPFWLGARKVLHDILNLSGLKK